MTEHLNKQTFLENVFNYEKNKEWKFEGDLPCLIDLSVSQIIGHYATIFRL